MNSEQPSSGTHTLGEITSQPSCWQQCLSEMEGAGHLDKMPGRFPPQADWLFIGCGSSYYIPVPTPSATTRWNSATGPWLSCSLIRS
jgi:hypothetical protein